MRINVISHPKSRVAELVHNALLALLLRRLFCDCAVSSLPFSSGKADVKVHRALSILTAQLKACLLTFHPDDLIVNFSECCTLCHPSEQTCDWESPGTGRLITSPKPRPCSVTKYGKSQSKTLMQLAGQDSVHVHYKKIE